MNQHVLLQVMSEQQQDAGQGGGSKWRLPLFFPHERRYLQWCVS